MAKPRKEGNLNTTIGITWNIKNKLRQHARPIRKTKNGVLYENDEEVITKMLQHYEKEHNPGTINNTYPIKR